MALERFEKIEVARSRNRRVWIRNGGQCHGWWDYLGVTEHSQRGGCGQMSVVGDGQFGAIICNDNRPTWVRQRGETNTAMRLFVLLHVTAERGLRGGAGGGGRGRTGGRVRWLHRSSHGERRGENNK
jgi:hypothetical protein